MKPQNQAELHQYYHQKVSEYQEQIKNFQKKINQMASARLAIAVAAIALGYYLYPLTELVVIVAVTGLVVFLLLVKQYNKISDKRTFAAEHISIYKEEINRLNRDFDGLDAGAEFIDGNHFYTSDLDIFGQGSIYQFVSRAKTIIGRERLAGWLKTLPPNEEILLRQKAIEEIGNLPEWREDFQATSRLFEEKRGEIRSILTWLQEPVFFLQNQSLKSIVNVFPFLVIAVWILTFWFIPVRVALLISGLQLSFVGSYTKKINQQHSRTADRFKVLHKYAQMLQLIENQEWNSEKMKAMHGVLRGAKGTASNTLFELTKIVNALDSRANLVGTLITNGLYMRDLKNALKLEKWKQDHKNIVENWFHALADTEALASLATFSFNNPTFVFPQLSYGEFMMETENLAHPLIKEETRIGNNLQINGWSQIMLITGSNMAGKSTFLRAVGVNYVLATTGAPVCASNFNFSPISLYTSMRIGDSIKDSESTFYAELKRIKTIIEHLQAGKPLFILLDEILRGTNSADKLTGSRALLKQLVALKGTGILATHDLALAKLEDEYPQNIRNYHFDVDIAGDKFDFSYKLKRGVCKTMNATLLMQKMGINLSDQ